MTFELAPIGDMVRLTVTHDRLVPGSDMERGIVEGWPRVLSSLKSFLETGKPLPTWAGKAVKKKDLSAARGFLSDDLLFVGLFETYHGPDEYLKALEGLLGITTRLDVKAVVAEGDQAAVFFELETVAPAAATTFVAEWMRIANGRIQRVQSAFDGRPFAAMFGG